MLLLFYYELLFPISKMPGNIVETQPAATETQPASALADTRPSIEGTFQSFDALRARVTLAFCSSWGKG